MPSPHDNPLLRGLVSSQWQRGKFRPEVGKPLVVIFPGEKLVTEIEGVVSNDAVVVKITGVPMAKSHFYKLGDIVPVKRKIDVMNMEIWEVVSDHELRQQEAVEKFRQDEAERIETQRKEAEALAQKAAGVEPKRPMLGPRRTKVAKKEQVDVDGSEG